MFKESWYYLLEAWNYVSDVESVQSTFSHLITTSVPRAMFTHFPVEHG